MCYNAILTPCSNSCENPKEIEPFDPNATVTFTQVRSESGEWVAAGEGLAEAAEAAAKSLKEIALTFEKFQERIKEAAPGETCFYMSPTEAENFLKIRLREGVVPSDLSDKQKEKNLLIIHKLLSRDPKRHDQTTYGSHLEIRGLKNPEPICYGGWARQIWCKEGDPYEKAYLRGSAEISPSVIAAYEYLPVWFLPYIEIGESKRVFTVVDTELKKRGYKIPEPEPQLEIAL